MSILVTGVTGFLGSQLFAHLKNNGYSLKAMLRAKNDLFLGGVIVPTIGPKSDFSQVFTGCEVVIHCAARVHVMNDNSSNPLESFREINTYGTLNLAQQAADAGIKRFIFISTIKVNGEFTELGKPFKPNDNYITSDPYGLSKYEAEVGLRKIAQKTGMEVVIIRPPLVYGVGVKANFASLLKLTVKGIPLPLGGIKQNKRSLVAIENLVDLIETCIDHPKAANQIFLVSDDDDISTTHLLKSMAEALNVSSKLIPIPASWITIVANLVGKPAISQRLCGSLQVDISQTKSLLGWKPPFSHSHCMKKIADNFLESN
ncbi:UDP-glucose 4-epimerase family protein [Litorilituus lipolyticus]|uniref:SDR family oxidoreductase n=1 Tax=Litorilituus lipolyticus TaxID=2491017 RepID=A0A502L9X5_9GAMM|nr:SDR family oxidoreductase [Litorilituus lipolyticus]TPH17047.1 SDR family oxidoreductase [Litorilituus lipolyticus]